MATKALRLYEQTSVIVITNLAFGDGDDIQGTLLVD